MKAEELTWISSCNRPVDYQIERTFSPGYFLLRFLTKFLGARAVCRYLSDLTPETEKRSCLLFTFLCAHNETFLLKCCYFICMSLNCKMIDAFMKRKSSISYCS